MRKPTDQTPYVFVYGTLMSGFGNNRLLKNSNLEYYATTEEEYKLVANSIPYLLEDEGSTYVRGEVYRVNENTLRNLDSLEGHPNWYVRKIVNVITDQGDRIRAWVYFMPEQPSGVSIIESGSYRDYVGEQFVY